MKIGMQFAMPAEFHALPGAKDLEPFETVSGVPFYAAAPDVIACAGGISKVNAAMAAEILILRYGVDLVVNAGVAGCMTDLPTGTLVVPSEFIQHDVDTTAIGDEPGVVSTVNRLAFPTWRPERCLEIVNALGGGAAGQIAEAPAGQAPAGQAPAGQAVSGRAATGDWFATASNDRAAARARWIRDTFHPLLVDMEGCAIAQVCWRNGVPFTALKSVSDHLFRENQVEEYFDFGQAIANLGRVLLPLVRELQKEAL